PEIASFADDLAAQFAAVDADRVIRAVPNLRVRLPDTLYVRADAAVVQQVDRCLEDRVDEFRWCQLFSVDAEHGACFRRQRDRFRAPRPYATTLRDQLGVVVGPR